MNVSLETRIAPETDLKTDIAPSVSAALRSVRAETSVRVAPDEYEAVKQQSREKEWASQQRIFDAGFWGSNGSDPIAREE